MYKYSIILPVRNGTTHIKECVRSILSQTFSDFDLLILDNCSNDGTLEWLNTVHDDRIKLYPASRPLSIEENWARILTIPKNEFMTLIGHDDLLKPDYLSIINELIIKYPSASLYQTHFEYIDNNGRTIRLCKPMKEIQGASEFLSLFLTNKIDSMGTGSVMRTTDYDSLGGIPMYPNLLFADFELWINLTRITYKATASETCFSFRIHQSMTTQSLDVKFHKAFKQFIKYLDSLKLTDNNFNKVIQENSLQFIEFYCRGLSHRLLRSTKNKREGLSVKKFLQECKEYADMLVPGNNFDPCKKYSIRLAKYIDSNFFTRSLFRFFKKIYPKPIIS